MSMDVADQREERIKALTASLHPSGKPHVSHEEATLIVQVIEGGRERDRAFARLLKLSESNTRRLERHLLFKLRLSKQDVEDAVQEASAAVVRELKKFKGTGKFSAWFGTIATRAAYAYIEQRTGKRTSKNKGRVKSAEEKRVGQGIEDVTSVEEQVDENEEQVAENARWSEPDQEGLPEDRASEGARMSDYMKMLRECCDRAGRNEATGVADLINQCLAKAWLFTFANSPDDTLQEVADRCGCDTSKADRVRKKLRTCIESNIDVSLLRESVTIQPEKLAAKELAAKKLAAKGSPK